MKYYNDNKDGLKDPKDNFPLGKGDYEDDSGKKGEKDPAKHPSDRFNSVFNNPEENVSLKLPFIQGARAIFAAPPEWGKRKALGKLQEIYGRLMLAELEYKRKLAEYQQYVRSLAGIKEALKDAKALSDALKTREILNLHFNVTLEQFEHVLKILAKELESMAKESETIIDAAITGIPAIYGFSNDLGAPVKGTIKTTSQVVNASLDVASRGAKYAAWGVPVIKAIEDIWLKTLELKEAHRVEIEKKVQEFNSKFGDEINLRLDIYEKLKEMEQLGNL